MAPLIHVCSGQWSNPGGLGQVVRQLLPAGRPIELDECRRLTGTTVLLADFPRPLSPANRNYAWTTFEGNRVPAEWVDALNDCYRAVFVPHPAVRRWFRRSGVRPPVHTVAQGFKRLQRTRPLPAANGRLRVGTMGLLLARKNVDALIRAVADLNDEGYAFSLTARFTCRLTSAMAETIERNRDRPHLDLSFTPELADEALADWYSGLHAYVCPSSGEGWSMTPRESMYLGIPTVVSDIPVHQELLRSGACTAIATSGREPAYYPFLGRTCGHWRAVSVAAIKQALVDLHDRYTAKRAAARRGAAWISRRWRWVASVRRLVALIRADGG